MTPNRRLSPLGRMLTLALNDATVVTKTTAILPLLADLWSDTPLFAPAGSLDHSQIQSCLGYLSTEVHAAISTLSIASSAIARGPR
ncbi:hypothetical protein LP416_21380 [Polaromonas sp. P2-4]|nr:hypothetical protein LP416_21380 [Polaromonas sp. P2-4]